MLALRCVVLVWWRISRARGSVKIDVEAARAMEERIHDLQRRAGQLSSFKALVLTRSPWPLGVAPATAVSETVGLYRIIGNPLPPRHDSQQLVKNLRYMLQHEPELRLARKIFVLNRLNASLEAWTKELVEAHGYEVLTIGFDPNEYRAYQTEDSFGLHPNDWGALNHPKFFNINANLYLMNNNGARNTALRDGVRRGFQWTLPFDGNCFFTRSQWEVLLETLAASEQRGVKFVAVPMVRTTVDVAPPGGGIPEAEHVDMPGVVSSGVPGEHQIVFHHSATLRFDPTVPYGHRPKVSLLWKLSIKGAWDAWNHDVVFRAEGQCVYLGLVKKVKEPSVCSRTLPRLYEHSKIQVQEATDALVYRLPDNWPATVPGGAGVGLNDTSEAWGDNYDARHNRKDLRDLAIVHKVEDVNTQFPPSTRGVSYFVKPLLFNVFSMEAMRRECLLHEQEAGLVDKRRRRTTQRPGLLGEHHCEQITSLVALADRNLRSKPFSVVDKRDHVLHMPANASLNHYQNLGIYTWRVHELPPDVDYAELQPLSSSASPWGDRFQDLVEGLRDARFRERHANEFVRWDGKMRPDGKLWGPGSEAYDRSRAFDMITNVTLYSLAHFYTGQSKYAEKAVSLVRTWFLHPATRMLPSKAFVQWSRPNQEATGLFQLRDFAYALDGLALVQRSTAWTQKDDVAMVAWCTAYAKDISTARERTSKSAHGWWYILQFAAVSRCAGTDIPRILVSVKGTIDKLVRVGATRPNGALPREMHHGNPCFITYGPILVWRFLQNAGDVETARRVGTLIRSTANALFATEKTKCTNAEHITPICQWALDFDLGGDLDFGPCKKLRSSLRDRRSLSTTPLPSAEAERHNLPPLLPSRPTHGLFPFTNLMW